MITRRRVLFGGLAFAAVAGLGLWGTDILTESEIASAVRRRLGMLKLDEAGLHTFAKDRIAGLLAKRPTWYRWKYHFRSLFAKSAAAGYGFSDDKRSRIERLEDALATVYLLSSDFFWNGADENRTVKYVALYDPVRPCGNPFARPALDVRPST